MLVKIIEFGPGQWLRAQQLVPPETPGRIPPAKPVEPGTVIGEIWLNFALVGAVSTFDEHEASPQAVENQGNGAASFPKIGTSYYFGAAHCALPYFAKVLETLPNGWFRVQELPFRGNLPLLGPNRWWINGSVVSTLQEAEPTDVSKQP